MIDQLLFSAALVAPEIGAAANSAFKQCLGGIAREMAGQAVQQAVAETKNALPSFVRASIGAVSGELLPSVTSMAASTVEDVLSKHLEGLSLVPTVVHQAQLAVIDAVRNGGDVKAALAALDAVSTKG